MKKQRLLFVLLMAMTMMALNPQSVWALDGNGTSASPYLIKNADDLFAFASKANGSEQGACAKLTTDLILTSEWTPVGSSSKPYTGTFDGQGHKILNLHIYTTGNNQGFFGYINNATITDLNLGGSISAAHDNIGSVVGYAKGNSKIMNTSSNVSIKYAKTAINIHLGGIVGYIENSTSVFGCTYNSTLEVGKSTDTNGGIVGFAHANCSGSITYCDFSGSVISYGDSPVIGGILGYTNDESKNFGGVQNCLSHGILSNHDSEPHVNAIVGRIRARATTTINNYYLFNSAKRACNNDGPSIPASNVAVSYDQLSSGEVCYMLNGNTNGTIWRQKLGDDRYPLLWQERDRVYKHDVKYCNGTIAYTEYSNKSTAITIHSYTPVNATDATCTKGGTIAYQKCSNCRHDFDSEGNELSSISTDPIGHSFDSDSSYCSRCKHGFLRYQSIYSIANNNPDLHEVSFSGKSFGTNVTLVSDIIDEKNKYHLVEMSGKITKIPSNAFENTFLIEFWLPSTLTTIESYAFQGSSLRTPKLPDSLTNIGERAFYNCFNMIAPLILPAHLSQIGVSAFEGCSKLSSISISNALTEIADRAFFGCSSITGALSIPSSVKKINHAAFDGCSKVSSITIPSSVTSIGSYAFCDCSGIKSITIPQSITSLGEGAFRGCGITSVSIPSSLTSINESVFQYCSKLTSVTIPTTVTYIGRWAFEGCSSLKSITIPNSVTNIEAAAFRELYLEPSKQP